MEHIIINEDFWMDSIIIDKEKLSVILNELADTVDRGYSSAGTWIGKVGNKPVKIIVMDMEFAVEEYDYSKFIANNNSKDKCIGVAK